MSAKGLHQKISAFTADSANLERQRGSLSVLHRILPSWVESDPLRSRATDALGLQAVADRLADRLLPGLSVLTTRARYFTFLAWARDVCGGEYQERKIHRYPNRLKR